MRWTVIVPMRASARAKSRLRPASRSTAAHRELVDAIRADCVAALRAAEVVAQVVVVAEDPGEITVADVLVVGEPAGAGLNGALRWAAAQAQARWPEDAVAAVVGDLAALRPRDVEAALDEAAGTGRAAVADRQGSGTTVLTATPGHLLDPHFGLDSARQHRASGALFLAAAPGLATDVDTPADLADAAALGLGAHTAAVLSERAAGRSA
ncbi:MAG: 2-phospho-L-lactate guanylyltransferase [bacterium]